MDGTATCVLPHRSTPSAVGVGAHELSTQALMLQGAAHELADARARLEQAEAVFSRALCVFTAAASLPIEPDLRAAAAARDLEQTRRGSTRVADFRDVLHTIDAYNERCLGVDAARSSQSNAVLRRIVHVQSERAAVAHALARGVIESDLAAAKRRQQSLAPLLRSLPSLDEVKAERLAALERGRAWLERSGISAAADSTLEEEEYVVVDQESPLSPRATPPAAEAAVPAAAGDGRSLVHAAKLASVVDRARHGLEGLLSNSRIGRQLRRKGAATAAAAPAFFGRALTDDNVGAALWFQRICGDYILSHGAKLTGVLRVPGDRAAVNALKASFDAHVAEEERGASGSAVGTADSCVGGSAAQVWTRGNAGASPLRQIGENANDVHAIASLLKLWYREMSEPLLTAALYSPLVALQALVARRGGGAPRVAAELWGQGAGSGGGAMASLPSCHARLLAELIRFLRKLSVAHAEMTAKNVAICIAPTVLRPAADLDPMARLGQLQSVRALFSFLFVHFCCAHERRSRSRLCPPARNVGHRDVLHHCSHHGRGGLPPSGAGARCAAAAPEVGSARAVDCDEEARSVGWCSAAWKGGAEGEDGWRRARRGGSCGAPDRCPRRGAQIRRASGARSSSLRR